MRFSTAICWETFLFYVRLEFHFVVDCDSEHFTIFSNGDCSVFAVKMRLDLLLFHYDCLLLGTVSLHTSFLVPKTSSSIFRSQAGIYPHKSALFNEYLCDLSRSLTAYHDVLLTNPLLSDSVSNHNFKKLVFEGEVIQKNPAKNTRSKDDKRQKIPTNENYA